MRINITKNQILQCFIHIYRRKRYAFLIVYTLIELRRDDLKDINKNNKSILDTILNLLVYRLQKI